MLKKLIYIFLFAFCFLATLFFVGSMAGANSGLPDYVIEFLNFGNDDKKKADTLSNQNHSTNNKQEIKQIGDDAQIDNVDLPDYVKAFLAFMEPLPFTQEDERLAETGNKVAIKKIKSGFLGRIEKYRPFIREAVARFNVPEEIIISVINTESGGRADAKNPTSSAKGLMQTIDGTYVFAKENLQSKNIHLDGGPYNPKSSILAGSWYLSFCFSEVFKKHPELKTLKKGVISHWNHALLYYFFGPSHEKNMDEKFVYYSNGKVSRFKGKAYADKILSYARIIS